MSLAKGPLIPGSTNFTTNFTKALKVSDIRADITTVSYDGGSSVLTGGILSGLKDPLLPQDAATKAYADSNSGGGAPGTPLNSIQFNTGGLFDGSANLLFDKTQTILTTTAITDGTVTFGAGRISNLTDPVLLQDAATKAYVDSFFSIIETTDATVGSTVYLGSTMINGIITRDPGTGSVTDTTDTAANIIASVTNPVVGMTFDFIVKNKSPDYTSELLIDPGTGVTIDFDTAITVYKDYVYNSKIIFENVTPTFEAVKIIITSNAFVGNDTFRVNLETFSMDTVRLTDYNPKKLTYNSPEFSGGQIASDIDYTYGRADIKNGLIVRSPATISTDTFSTFLNIIGSNTPGTFETQNFWETGSVEFYIVNEGTGNIVLTPGPNLWTMDANSNMTIFPGQTGWFLIYMIVDYYVPTSSSGTIYTIGIFDTV